jgi:hypothetical protein
VRFDFDVGRHAVILPHREIGNLRIVEIEFSYNLPEGANKNANYIVTPLLQNSKSDCGITIGIISSALVDFSLVGKKGPSMNQSKQVKKWE